MKKKLSDMVFLRIMPPDKKKELTIDDLSKVIVRRLGLKRKKSKANHASLLKELIKSKKENTPLSIERISEILGVSLSQTYEEIRKWRSLGILEFVKIPLGDEFIKGYMLTGSTVNRLLDRVEASVKSFLRKTRRIAKDFDDSFMLEIARAEKSLQEQVEKELKEEQVEKEIAEEREEGSEGEKGKV